MTIKGLLLTLANTQPRDLTVPARCGGGLCRSPVLCQTKPCQLKAYALRNTVKGEWKAAQVLHEIADKNLYDNLAKEAQYQKYKAEKAKGEHARRGRTVGKTAGRNSPGL